MIQVVIGADFLDWVEWEIGKLVRLVRISKIIIRDGHITWTFPGPFISAM